VAGDSAGLNSWDQLQGKLVHHVFAADLLTLISMRVRVLSGFVLLALASLAKSADAPPLPWAFVNGAANGYSIKLESASPAAGTPISVGQLVEFKIRVSFQLSIADKGSILFIAQDETDKSVIADRRQPSQSVDRGKGTVLLTESFVVPAGCNEIRLFIPLVPSGISHTSGELVIRYPVTDSTKLSGIGYPSVAAALADLHSKPEVIFREEGGWIIAEDRSHYTLWSFATEGDPAYPSAVKRTAVQQSGGDVTMSMNILCESTQDACDKLVANFNELNERARDSLKSK
jgi:hypothetical protein